MIKHQLLSPKIKWTRLAQSVNGIFTATVAGKPGHASKVENYLANYRKNFYNVTSPAISLVDDSGTVYGIAIDIDCHTPEQEGPSAMWLSKIRAHLDATNIKYAIEATTANRGVHIWILSNTLCKLDAIAKLSSEIKCVEVFPRCGEATIGTIGQIRLPGTHKDTTHHSFDFDDPNKKPFESVSDVDAFFTKAENDIPLNVIFGAIHAVLAEAAPKQVVKTKGTKSSADSVRIPVEQDILTSLAKFINENNNVFALGKKGSHFDFNYNAFHDVVVHLPADCELRDLLNKVDTFFSSIKAPTDTTDANSWCRIDQYSDDPNASLDDIRSIEFRRNSDPTRCFAIFEGLAKWDFDDFARKAKYMDCFRDTLAPLYYVFDGNARIVPLLKCANSFIVMTEKDKITLLDKLQAIIKAKCGGKCGFKFARSSDIVNNRVGVLARDSGTQYIGQVLTAMDALTEYHLPAGKTEEELLDTIYSNIPIDTSRIPEAIARRELRLTVKSIARAALIYIPKDVEKIGGPVSDKLKDALHMVAKIREQICPSYGNVFIGASGSGKTEVAIAFCKGALRAIGLNLSDPLYGYGSDSASAYTLVDDQTTKLDLSGFLKYSTTIVYDEYVPRKHDDNIDTICSHLTKACGRSGRFAHEKRQAFSSNTSINIFLAFTSDREEIFNYKAGNERRFLYYPLYVQSTRSLADRAASSVRLAEAVEELTKYYLSCFLQDVFFREDDTLLSSAKEWREVAEYVAGLTKAHTPCSPLVDLFKQDLYASYSKDLKAKYPELVNMDKQNLDAYKGKSYAWIIASDPASLLKQYMQWRGEKYAPKEDSTEVKFIKAHLRERGVEKIAVKNKATGGGTEKRYRLLFVDSNSTATYDETEEKEQIPLSAEEQKMK